MKVSVNGSWPKVSYLKESLREDQLGVEATRAVCDGLSGVPQSHNCVRFEWCEAEVWGEAEVMDGLEEGDSVQREFEDRWTPRCLVASWLVPLRPVKVALRATRRDVRRACSPTPDTSDVTSESSLAVLRLEGEFRVLDKEPDPWDTGVPCETHTLASSWAWDPLNAPKGSFSVTGAFRTRRYRGVTGWSVYTDVGRPRRQL